VRARRTAPTVAILVILLFTSAARRGEAEELRDGQRPQTTASVSPQSVASALEEATRLQHEADVHARARQLKEAAEKTEQALAIRRQHLGEMHPDVAYSMSQLGDIAFSQGQYDRAETLISGALKIREATLPPDHLNVADSLGNLAAILLVRGDYIRPEPLYQQALTIYERALASGQTSVPPADLENFIADVLNNRALLYHRRGNYAQAESQYLQALAIRERTRGADDSTVARTLADLGGVYYVSGQYEKAIQVLRRALGIQEPRNERSLATTNSTLAAVYFDQGDYRNAEAFFRRALAIDERTLDAQHPTLATRLVNLAEVLRLTGEYASADPLYERALAIQERALGATHPQVATTLIARSLLRYAAGNFDGAVDLLSRGAELREEAASYVLTTGSEDEKRLYLRTLVDETDIAISLHLGSALASTPAARLALTNIVQRKGRSIDAMTDQMAMLRRRLNDADRDVLNQFSEARARLASMVLRGVATDAQRQSVTAQRSEIQRLEQAISARSREFQIVFRTPTLGQLQEMLPTGTALIEFVSYRRFFVRNARKTAFAAPRYAAYVLRGDGIAAGIDLGEAASIDRDVEQFRTALSNPNRDARAPGRALHHALIAPISASLRAGERIIISPDGALNLIPFSALVGEDGTYLVEHATISYVGSGRDLIRVQSKPDRSRALAAPTIVANPTFGPVPAMSASSIDRQQATRALPTSSELKRSLQFSDLPGTAQEARAIAKVLPDARVYTGAKATEALLKELSAPSILHIATHGFFLQPHSSSQASTSNSQSIATAQAGAAVDREDALVLSGLALAGANRRQSGAGEDGILTALEVTALDLRGTRMVVLSACETALGDAKSGEGVYGLRRALVLAGSESQVMTLWKVSDEATRDLMIGFYQRLQSGEGRAEALRNSQLAFLSGTRNRSHPFYWASFIQSGDWRALD
jgi:CHAT domain-containing protein/tetratricopeptide (TPR) repeat protein